jgi:anthranilate phosphoribosyltransferase
MLQDAIKKIGNRENLSEKQAYDNMNEIMKGQSTPSQIGAYLMGLRLKGETIDEITGSARAMRDNASVIKLKSEYVIDTCGTGGDGGKTFNISTAVAIIAASGGVKVAKHGNRAVSSKSGSADVLSELGFNIDLEPEQAAKTIEEKGMAFLFAQKYHSAMKNVAPIRKELGLRTIFNIIGPLTNPAFVKGQVMGVYDKNLTNPLANVLLKMGCKNALVVHGKDGLDEITTTNVTYVSELKKGVVIDYIIDPIELGLPKATPQEILGGSAHENAIIILDVLKGIKGPKREIVLINAAAALYIGNKCENIKQGLILAKILIDSGKAYEKLQELIKCSGAISA